jgi:restriction endonuclease S subunit
VDEKPASFSPETDSPQGAVPALLVSISKLAETDEYNLSADRYREVIRVGKQTHKMVALEDVCERIADNIDPTQFSGDVKYIGLENIESNTGELVGEVNSTYESIKSAKTRFAAGDILYGKLRPNLNKVYLAQFSGICSTDIFVLRTKQNAEKSYIREMLRSPFFNTEVLKGLGGAQLPRVSFDYLSNLQIPLPSLEIQRQLVDEIAAHQRIIDGARQVVEGWKPNVEIDPEWSIVKLEELFEITSSKRVFEAQWKDHGVPFYRAREIVLLARNGSVDNELFISEEMFSEYTSKYGIPKEGDMMVTGVGTLGVCYVVQKNDRFYFKDGNILWFKKNSDVETHYIEYLFQTDFVRNQIDNTAGAVVGTYTIIRAKNTLMPLPPLEIQREIVARIETERAIVHGNRELIRLYEEKVKKVIERVWQS